MSVGASSTIACLPGRAHCVNATGICIFCEREVKSEKTYTIPEVNRMLRAAGWGPFCSNPECRCVIPFGAPCPEFKKMIGKKRCAECGWPEKEHE